MSDELFEQQVMGLTTKLADVIADFNNQPNADTQALLYAVSAVVSGICRAVPERKHRTFNVIFNMVAMSLEKD